MDDSSYQPLKIELEVQKFWKENHHFEAKEDLHHEKFYCLSMMPYPSGELHMGHVRNYTIGDVIARYQMMQGKNVLHPMGWDAFGLPAENAAIERKLSPSEWTRKNINKMRKQFQQMGYAFDWKREISTCDPSYYRWEQWLFIQLYQKGLVYRKNALVNWDPVDQTVLANEQLVDGKGWRSGATVERREIPQWFFKITDYAEELLEGLNHLKGWPEKVIQMQRNWIGLAEGVQVSFKLSRSKEPLSIFTTRADTLMGVTCIAVALNHPLSEKLAKKNPLVAEFIKECNQVGTAEAEVVKQEKLGMDTKLTAIHPLTQERIPVWIANFVLSDYGCGAVMCVPAHDLRDFEFAKKYNLRIQPVLQPTRSWDFQEQPFIGTAKLIHSGPFDGLTSKKAIKVITKHLEEQGSGQSTVHYRLRDWGVSRQRYWGTPIPMIYCNACGLLPVPESDLPVLLPEDLIPEGHGSPLASCPEFYKTTCPQCGKAAKRETDTMDTFMESSWYYARYCCFDQDNAMLDGRVNYWTPVDQYIGGVEHAVMHLLYARFMHKVLRDQGLVNSEEPFTHLLTQGMVLKDGFKMSKSKGNVVTPQPLIKKYGADTLRLFIIFAAPPESSLEWSDFGVEGAYRFLKKLWNFCMKVKENLTVLNKTDKATPCDLTASHLQQRYQQLHQLLQQAHYDMQRLHLNTVASSAMKIFNLLTKLNALNAVDCQFIQESLSILLRLLAPIAPHITQTLWRQLEFGYDILEAGWPKINVKALQSTSLELPIQVNGKLRGKITIPSNSDEAFIKKEVLNNPNIQRHIEDRPIKKFILVPGRLVNLVV